MSDDLLAELTRAIDELIAAAKITDADLSAAAVLWSAEPVDDDYLRACKAVAIGRMLRLTETRGSRS